MNQLIIQNAECLATLVGVVLYEHLKGITFSHYLKYLSRLPFLLIFTFLKVYFENLFMYY